MTEVVEAAAAELREPKQNRSRLTRERLLAATIDLLARQGWAAVTVGAVAAAAGVSRGAAQHHFPTRDELITAALEYMFDERLSLVLEHHADLPEGPERLHAVIRTVVEYYTGDLFKAALQVWTAAASDPQLRERILPLENRFSREVFAVVAESLSLDLGDESTRRGLQATLDLARGLGLADVLSDDSARREKLVRFWADQLSGTLLRR